MRCLQAKLAVAVIAGFSSQQASSREIYESGPLLNSRAQRKQRPAEALFSSLLPWLAAVHWWDIRALQRFVVRSTYSLRYYHNGRIAAENLAGCDLRVLMHRTIPFIRQSVAAAKAFLAVIWFHAPHEPVDAGPEFRQKYSESDAGDQSFFGAVTALDVQVGRLRHELRELGVADNTMFWFASDNGPEGETGDKPVTLGVKSSGRAFGSRSRRSLSIAMYLVSMITKSRPQPLTTSSHRGEAIIVANTVLPARRFLDCPGSA